MLFVDLIRSDFKHLHFVDQVEDLVFGFVLQSLLAHGHLSHEMSHIVPNLGVVARAAFLASTQVSPPAGSGTLLFEGRGLGKVATAFSSEERI